uniref:Uncharacterized protein n=1 Tax=Timema bartmani TaxID=61472 RepID=A0A7R9I131_9NEOP|nr:unnamed protein product [Timema bartmani]
MFLMSLGFSIILTGVWPYLDKLDPAAGKEFMGYVVGANPLGQMLFSPLVGWWGNKTGSIRLPLLSSLVMFTLASAAYSMLEIFNTYRKYWMLLARFFVGVSSVARSPSLAVPLVVPSLSWPGLALLLLLLLLSPSDPVKFCHTDLASQKSHFTRMQSSLILFFHYPRN